MSHRVWDDSKTATSAPVDCQDCGDAVYAWIEFNRNSTTSRICFDCIRDANVEVNLHCLEHGEPKS